jgi:hypothetical protein
VNPALAGKKVRCPVCLEVVTAPHLAVPVEEESGGSEQPKDPIFPPIQTPVPEVAPPEGLGLEIPDNPSIAPLSPNESSHESLESPGEPKLEIPEDPPIYLAGSQTDNPLPPGLLPEGKPIEDLWDEEPPKKTPSAVPALGKGPPPLPTGIQELSGPLPGAAPALPVAIPVFASPDAITEGRPPVIGAEEEDYAEVEAVGRPTKTGKRKERRRQIRRVQLGLGFHFWKYLTYVLGINLIISGVILATFLSLLGILVVTVGYIAILISPVLGIVGSILCTSVPAKTEAKPLITVSLGLDASCLALGFLGGFIGLVTRTLPGREGIAFLVFLISSAACGLAGFVMFMLFLRKFATFLDDHKSADEAMTQMINLLVVVLGGGAIMIITAAILFNIEAWLATLALGVEYLAFFILYLKVLFSILDLISTIRARIN